MKLFEPGKIGTMTVKNRIVMAPMGLYGLPAPDGSLTQRSLDFYLERARGGAGLIFPTATGISREFEDFESVMYSLDGVGKALKWSEMAEKMHHYGCRLGMQMSPGVGRMKSDFLYKPDHVPVSASAVPAFWRPRVVCRPLEVEEIKRLVAAAGRTALLAKRAGVDTIEIHGYGGYLIDQFMSSLWNRRNDEYGGDLDGRLRFPLEMLEEIRRRVGAEYPIVFKFTPDHDIPGGRTMEEGLEIARRLEAAGVDALHVDFGCYECWHRTIPPVYAKPASQIEAAAAVKAAVKIPVIGHGKLNDPELAERVLAQGKVDFVGLGRAFLADPEWPLKVKEGRPEDIRHCIGCSEGCFARGIAGRYASCAVNPECAMERDYRPQPAEKPRKILVIGGGPGGMTAAVTAANRGHKVSLWERGAELGGTLWPAAAPEFKRDIRRYIDHLKAQVAKGNIDLKLKTDVSAKKIMAVNPDLVVIATGGEPLVPDLPGLDSDRVMTAVDVLLGKRRPGENVLVVGAGVVGCETAVFLADKGKKVTLIEKLGRLIPEPLFTLNYNALVEMVSGRGIRVMVNCSLLEADAAGAVVEMEGEKRHIDADSIVLAMGFRPVDTLAEELKAKGREVVVIGDAKKPRKVLDAVWEGFHAARLA
ncbi:MAG: FAD-dependent oxidoreductase [Deltaproteobacteria bacterium]|nr:FAD-dependent oxidoreductase [Deltaproteobacteria bacterium]